MVSLVVFVVSGLVLLVLVGLQFALWLHAARGGMPPRWEVEETLAMACSPGQAFAFVGDPRNDVRHAPQVVAVALDAPGGIRAGVSYRETIRFGGRDRALSCTITQYDPPRAIGLSCTLGRRPVTGGYRVVPHPVGCAVTALSGTTYTAAGILVAPLARPLTRRVCRADLERIRAILETPTGAIPAPITE